MGRHPIIQQKNFSCLLRVSSFVRFEKVSATEIHEKNYHDKRGKEAKSGNGVRHQYLKCPARGGPAVEKG